MIFFIHVICKQNFSFLMCIIIVPSDTYCDLESHYQVEMTKTCTPTVINITVKAHGHCHQR